ncbi:hypothetical protein DRW41_09270 [Neobacillus piezotolerans]|uniref:Uncharacterized protein n=1 Tax=Neobacillus piezotolerans TaxID=2259171 RepID=A0A3D8GQW2_9BACI|nr:hypothetical protein [Neobacillus piezotolerans]RDU36885.1 hypothetical protein DRW41_09270 [Neobacillus piezotolerans]
MGQFNEELKSALHGSLPEESILSEAEKQQIRERIKGLQGKKLRKPRDILPKTLTALVAAAVLLAGGGIAGKELGLLDIGTGSRATTPDFPFYDGVDEGNFLNGWELVKKGPVGEKIEGNSSLMEARFTGKAILIGTLIYHGAGMGDKANKIFFVPDKEVFERLPINPGIGDEFTFNQQDADQLAMVFGLAANSMREGVEIEVTGYTAYARAELNIPDILKLERVVIPEEPEITYSSRPVPLNEKGNLELTDTLKAAYDEFAQTHNEVILHTLDSYSVFLFFFYAEQIRDYETQFALFNDDPDVTPIFTSVEEYVKVSQDRDMDAGNEKLLKKVLGSPLKQVAFIGDDEAVVTISEEDGLGFRLVKNHKGIWKVSWLPIQ